jgi:hypothetical protein
MDDPIDLEKRRRQARRAELSMERLDKIIKWSVEMRRRGLMPDDVARAFSEHFGGKYEDGEPV